jgi:hypothetical protein
MLRGAPTLDPARARRAQEISFPAPVAGWISNRALAMPSGMDGKAAQGAEILDNFFPTATGIVLRRGSQTYAQLGEGDLPVTAMFKYVVGNNRKLFAATETTVYDITVVTQSYNYSIGIEDEWTMALEADPDSDTIGQNSTPGLEVIEGALGGNWSTVQFATTGGVFLIGVNGASTGFIYDGTTFYLLEGDADPLFPGVTFPSGSSLTTADLSYVWVYKNRLWFIQKESLTAWYLDIDQIGGELKPFYLGSEFPRGGALIFGQNWSLSGGDQGGLSEQCVFASTEGEVVVYQGISPAESATWSKVGLYRIGNPLGTKGLIRAGGDLVIATNIGFIPLSAAIEFDIAALGQRAVSQPIEVSWFEAVPTRGGSSWSAVLWAEQQMLVVAPPTVSGTEPTVFIANARTGAWSRFTNWDVTCMETFNGRLLFGGPNGFIKDAMVGGTDDGIPYTGSYMPLFSDAGSPTARKAARIARSTTRSSAVINERLGCRFDFDRSLPPPPDVAPVPVGNEWNNAIWDQSVWDAGRDAVVSQRRHSVSGSGYRIAPTFQVTSGSAIPLDVELVSLEVTFDTGGGFL